MGVRTFIIAALLISTSLLLVSCDTNAGANRHAAEAKANHQRRLAWQKAHPKAWAAQQAQTRAFAEKRAAERQAQRLAGRKRSEAQPEKSASSGCDAQLSATTSVEDRATSDLTGDNYLDAMGHFAEADQWRINCMKNSSGFSHTKQEAYAAVDAYGIAEAMKLGNMPSSEVDKILAGANMFAGDVLSHDNVPEAVREQMEKIQSDAK